MQRVLEVKYTKRICVYGKWGQKLALLLECGHVEFRNKSQGTPRRVICSDCRFLKHAANPQEWRRKSDEIARRWWPDLDEKLAASKK